jgi:hypothetical protein
MKKQALLTYLIAQDMKYHHLLHCLESAGFMATNKNRINLLEPIASLMNAPVDGDGDQWVLRYLHFMARASKKLQGGQDIPLRSLANMCYKELSVRPQKP